MKRIRKSRLANRLFCFGNQHPIACNDNALSEQQKFENCVRRELAGREFD